MGLCWNHNTVHQSKWLVAGCFTLAALWKHDAEIIWISLGAVANSLLSVILKRMLNHERPSSALRSDPGMPSSHAQSIFFAATVLILSCKYFRIHPVFGYDLIMTWHFNSPANTRRSIRLRQHRWLKCVDNNICISISKVFFCGSSLPTKKMSKTKLDTPSVPKKQVILAFKFCTEKQVILPYLESAYTCKNQLVLNMDNK